MSKLLDLAAEISGQLQLNARRVLLSLSDEYAPPPRTQTRQLTASVASRHSNLIEREWQAGCANCTYYRLTPLGVAVADRLRARAAMENTGQ